MKTAIFVTTIIINILFAGRLCAQSFQTVRGTVTERGGGAPVAYASVALVGGGTVAGGITDSLGRFSLQRVPVGRYDVEASCVGYGPAVVKAVVVSSSKEVVLDISLREDMVSMGAVTVRPNIDKSEPLNIMALGGGRMLSVEEAGRYAGGMDDPARLVSAFAGVTSNVGSNGIVVRGNAPKALQWRMEGVEIPNPNHFADVTGFGGGLTALSSQVLGNSDFYTGAFPAEYGNALSGVFDMTLREGNNTRHEHTAQIGILGIDAASEGPLAKGYGGSYIFNYRYSTLALLAPLLPEDAEGTAYQDLSFKISLPASRAGVFSVWGVGLVDRSGTVAETDPAKWVYDQDMEDQDVRQYMGAAGVNHSLRVGEHGTLKTSLAVTVSGLDIHTERMNAQAVPVPENVIRNTDWNFVFSTALTEHFGGRHTNRTGFRVTGLMYDTYMRNAGQEGLETVADETGMSALIALYSSSVLRLTPRWRVSAGLYGQLFTLNGSFSVEPRASAEWSVSPKSTLSLSYGMHSRLERLNYYFARAGGAEPNRGLDFTKAHHLSAAYDRDVGGNAHLKVEPYVQILYSVPVIEGTTFSFLNLRGDDDWFVTGPLTNGGRGLNCGVDVTFERYMSRGFYYMVSASLFDARYRTAAGEWFNTRFNRNFALNLLAGREWMTGRDDRNMLGINGRVTLQGGDRFSPVDEAASAERHEAVYDESRPYSEQLPPAFVGHLTVSYRMNRRRVSHEVALKVLNITGYRDYYGHRYNHVENRVEPEREANIVPNISYRIEF